MATKPYPSETQDRFIVRLPDGMRDRIAEEAKSNSRSMNSEIIARLEASFDAAPMPPGVSMALANALAEVADYANEHGVTPDEALSGLISAALSRDAAPVYFFVIDKEMKMPQIREMFAVASEHVPANATVHLHTRETVREAAPEPMPTVKRIRRTPPKNS